MIAYLPIVLFTVTALTVAMVLADCMLRFGNAWTTARRELVSAEADLSFDQLLSGGVIVAINAASPNRPSAAAARLSARRLPHAVAA